tara:strand:- start:76 stop:519 length:444 start_codon:yes stop_codon:yes gene_type:complete
MKNSAGFTLVEVVVAIALMGILIGTSVPIYNNVITKTQISVNTSNMIIIKDTFMRYFNETYMDGNPQLPTLPQNALLDSTYNNTELSDGRTPNNLFNGGLPFNSNGNPYTYYWEADTSSSGFITKKFYIEDLDTDSPSYGEFVVGEI